MVDHRDGDGQDREMAVDPSVAQFNPKVIEAFRESKGHGELGPVHFDRMVLLTTTGRRSGTKHTVPLGVARDDDNNLILFGSNMGSPTEPDWVANIRADSSVHVELTDQSFDANAVVLTGEARGAAYQRWLDYAPNTASHQDQAGREIPMILISPPAPE
jgi:deazaflavin-dependent oxidoreductase (nitroreductase family)